MRPFVAFFKNILIETVNTFLTGQCKGNVHTRNKLYFIPGEECLEAEKYCTCNGEVKNKTAHLIK